ncbi:MAG: hypothetical protein QXP38_08730 [Nitrososphaerota archaeon]
MSEPNFFKLFRARSPGISKDDECGKTVLARACPETEMKFIVLPVYWTPIRSARELSIRVILAQCLRGLLENGFPSPQIV